MRRLIAAAAIISAFVIASAFAWRAYLINELREQISNQLLDPESAQFRNERLFSAWTLSSSALCGEVNARNRMGGYVGYAPFSVVAGLVHISDQSETQFKRERNLPLCAFDAADIPWWHIRW